MSTTWSFLLKPVVVLGYPSENIVIPGITTN